MIRVNRNGHRGKYGNSKVGRYLPIHPEKYKGNENPIFKSNLERLFMRYCDSNENVVYWSYEGLHIKYLDKSSNPEKTRNYYIDFTIWVKSPNGLRKIWVEIKPKSETVKPKDANNTRAMMTWLKNMSKWNQAKITAKQCGAEFKVLTEEQLR